MIAVRDHLNAIAIAPAQVVVVTFAAAEELSQYRSHVNVPFSILSDPERSTYRSYQLGRGSFRDIYGMGTLRMYASLLRKGRKLRRPAQDTRQLGGDFVIDRDGRIAAAFYPTSPDDRPSIAQLASAVAALRN